MVHAQHFITSLGLLCWFLHQRILVTTGIQVRQQLWVDEVLGLQRNRTEEISCHCVPDHSILPPTSTSFQAAFSFSYPPYFSPSLWLSTSINQWDKYIVYHEVHDCLRHEVSDGFVDNCHVGIHQIPDCFHLSLQLRVHGVHETVWSILLRFAGLQREAETGQFFKCNTKLVFHDGSVRTEGNKGRACNKTYTCILSCDYQYAVQRVYTSPAQSWGILTVKLLF